MTAIRGIEIRIDPLCKTEIEKLRPKYQDIDAVIEGFSDVMRLDYSLPEILVNKNISLNVYSTHLDYPPLGMGGRGILQVVYHKSPRRPFHPTVPFMTVTILHVIDMERPIHGIH